MKNILFTLLLSFLFACIPKEIVRAQYITHGPVMGGVTDSSLRIFLRCASVQNFIIDLDTDSLFSNPLSFQNTTIAAKDFSAITECSGLQANTTYFYRVRFGAIIDSNKGYFKTFPLEGSPAHFTFVAGSCQETPNMKVFDVMPTYNPLFMLHMGDYTYPSYQLPSSYPEDWNSIPVSYRKRYEEAVMKDKLIPFVPLVYMPDDDDNFGPTRTLHVSTSYTGTFPNIVNQINTSPIQPIEKTHCLRGYRYFFPGYATVDTTEGHYHSFKVGNAEFFVTDTRSMADPWSEAYSYDTLTNLWSYTPSPSHTILGTNQMNWLLTGLTNSTAQWKFVVTGVPFNPKLYDIVQSALIAQGYAFNIAGQSGTGMRLSTSFAGYWGGYPDDVNQVIQHVTNQQISGVMVLSGDTHNNVMDDGTNSFFPELNASGLSVSSTELAYQMSMYAPLLGLPPLEDSLWNGGGNGIFNANIKNGFGKVEVFEDDSVTFCVIDEDDIALSCMTIYADGSVLNTAGLTTKGYLDPSWSLYPNPTNDKINIKGSYLSENCHLVIYDLTGKIQHRQKLPTPHLLEYEISLPESLENGLFLIQFEREKIPLGEPKKLLIQRN
jgi:alkaline phosphatase D